MEEGAGPGANMLGGALGESDWLVSLLAGGSEDGSSSGASGSGRGGGGGDSGVDINTQAVVVMTQLLEAVVQRLLEGALAALPTMPAAAGEASEAAASAAAAAGADGAALRELQPRDLVLAAAADPLLSALLLQRRSGAGGHSVCVAGAGVVPAVRALLLPDAESEPLAALLLQVGRDPRCLAPAAPAPGWRLLFPLDLRYYCGGPVSSAAGASPAAASSAAANAASARCCFLSGAQCGGCSGAHAQLEGSCADLEAQLAACSASWEGVLRASSDGAPADAGRSSGLRHQLLREGGALLAQLLLATRLYHTQSGWWYEAPEQLAPEQAAALLAHQPLLRQLWDVAALQQVQLEQRRVGPALEGASFEAMAEDLLEGCLQEGAAAQAAAAGAGPATAGLQTWGSNDSSSAMAVDCGGDGASTSPAGALAAAEGGGASTSGGDGSSSKVDLSSEAIEALQAAAEQLVVEQLGLAQDLALHAGRQQVTPADLALALRSSGYGHLLAGSSEAAQQQQPGAGVLSSLL